MKSCLKKSLTLFSPVQLRVRPVLKNVFRENVKIGSSSVLQGLNLRLQFFCAKQGYVLLSCISPRMVVNNLTYK